MKLFTLFRLSSIMLSGLFLWSLPSCQSAAEKEVENANDAKEVALEMLDGLSAIPAALKEVTNRESLEEARGKIAEAIRGLKEDAGELAKLPALGEGVSTEDLEESMIKTSAELQTKMMETMQRIANLDQPELRAEAQELMQNTGRDIIEVMQKVGEKFEQN